MLHEFLTVNRSELIGRCRAKVSKRTAPRPSDAELVHGIPLFLEQLIAVLKIEQTSTPSDSRTVSGPSEPTHTPDPSEIATTAARHGVELLRHGFTVDQVVHDYGDLCQSITELAVEDGAQVTADEFRTLNRCLDNGIAEAVTEFSRQREIQISAAGTQATGEHLGFLAHELRNLVDSAMLAVAALKAGDVGISGVTGAVLDRSLIGLRNLIDRSLAEVRLTSRMAPTGERVHLTKLIAEVQVGAVMEARARGCALTVLPVDGTLVVHVDRQMLSSAVANLLQNAFKFTRPNSHVSLRVSAAEGRALIEIEDECGGLPPGATEKLFQPFEQRDADRSGLGLGLSITQRSVEMMGGTVRARDLRGVGCVFTIDLPLRSTVLEANT